MTGFFVKSMGQPKLGGTTDARAFVPVGMNALFLFHPSHLNHPVHKAGKIRKEKKMDTINQTDETKQVEHEHMQEHTSLPIEDRSLSAEQVLTQQAEQENRPSLFVP
jgi:hypothetical protein